AISASCQSAQDTLPNGKKQSQSIVLQQPSFLESVFFFVLSWLEPWPTFVPIYSRAAAERNALASRFLMAAILTLANRFDCVYRELHPYDYVAVVPENPIQRGFAR